MTLLCLLLFVNLKVGGCESLFWWRKSLNHLTALSPKDNNSHRTILYINSEATGNCVICVIQVHIWRNGVVQLHERKFHLMQQLHDYATSMNFDLLKKDVLLDVCKR